MKNVPCTIGELLKDKSDKPHLNLVRDAVDRASSLMGGRSFDGVKIRSVAEMGDAAGTCQMDSGEISVREDMVHTAEGARKSLTRVLVHEANHARGISSEGVTELLATEKTDKIPVPAYAEKVRHAEKIAGVIGGRRVLEEVAREEGDRGLVVAITREKLRGGGLRTIQGVQQIIREAEDEVRMAA